MQNTKLKHSVLMGRFTIFQSHMVDPYASPTTGPMMGLTSIDAIMVAELLDTKPSPARIDVTKSSVL
jgi:hypothetical protein